MFEKLWKSPALSKVVAFAWKVLLNRVPTKVNLALRNVLAPEESNVCVMCNMGEESSLHLFFHCDLASSTWRKYDVVAGLFLSNSSKSHCPLGVLEWGGRNKNITKGLLLIWNTTIWALWKVRTIKVLMGLIMRLMR